MFTFICPHCDIATRVADDLAGRRGRCIGCGELVLLPGSPIDAAAVARRRLLARRVAAVTIGLLLIGGLGWTATQLVRAGGARMRTLAAERLRGRSMRNLEKIAEALNAYSLDHGRYPPPVTVDAAGMPLHSWRVTLLPYLDQDELFNSIDRSKPWDDPSNMRAGWNMPAIYRHPDSNLGGYSTPAYHIIAGPGTLFPPGGQPLGPDDVVDDPAQTILVAEAMPMTSGNGSWMEPGDLDYAVMSGDLTAGSLSEIGGLTDGGACLATVDGRTHFLRDDVRPSTVRALITPAGGERLPSDVLD